MLFPGRCPSSHTPLPTENPFPLLAPSKAQNMSLNIGESTGRPPSAAFIRKPRVHTLDEIGTLVSSGHELPARGNRSSVTVPTHAALARRSTVRRASQGLSWVPAVGSGDKLKDPPASGTASVVTGRSLCLSDEQSKQHDLREPKSPAATTDNDSELGTPLPCPEIVVNYEQSPWQTFTRLGELVQGKQRHIVCIRKHIMRETYMFKASNLSLTKAELLKSLTHPNLLSIRHVFIHNHIVYVGMVYTRHTLEEILHVHLSLEESHIQAIAQSVGLPVCGPDSLLTKTRCSKQSAILVCKVLCTET